MTELFAAIDAFNEMSADPDKVDAPGDDEMAALLARFGGGSTGSPSTGSPSTGSPSTGSG